MASILSPRLALPLLAAEFHFRIFSLRWREKFEKHNKLFSFSPRLWWVQALGGAWLAEFLTLRQVRPIWEQLSFFGCPGQRHLCTSEGRSSENWRNIKKDQGCSAIDASAAKPVSEAEFLLCVHPDLWQWQRLGGVMKCASSIVDYWRRGSGFSCCGPCCAICC